MHYMYVHSNSYTPYVCVSVCCIIIVLLCCRERTGQAWNGVLLAFCYDSLPLLPHYIR